MILEVDKIMETNLPVKVALRASPVASSVRLKDLVVDPPQVTVRGPASVIASMKEIQAEIPVDLGRGSVACPARCGAQSAGR